MPRNRTCWLCVAGVPIALLLAACGKETPEHKPVERQRLPQIDASAPNVVVISIDTLRPDHLSCYGYQRPTSPRIDQFAAESALFEHAVSSTSWTLPAHCALFTGLVDTVHGCFEMDRRLDESRYTLAERLKDVGYQTAGFFAAPALHPIFGLSQGFDTYVDCTSYAELAAKQFVSGQPLDGGPVEYASHSDITNPKVCAEVHDWLDAHASKGPFFMFIHLWDVHFDFIPPPPYDTMFDPDYQGDISGRLFADPRIHKDMDPRDLQHVIALYDGEIRWTDEHIGKILDDFDARGLRDNTLVVLLSDHGEEFFEHGGKAHRQTLFEEVIRIPLIIRFPDRVPAGARIREQARMIDILPTIFDLVDLPEPEDVMGQSLVPAFAGEPLKQDNLAVSELFSVGQEVRSFRRPDRKMIYDEKREGGLMYDLAADPHEQRPLPGMESPLAQLLANEANAAREWIFRFQRLMPVLVSPPSLPPRVRAQLESLGYISAGDEGDEDIDEE